NRRRFVKTIRAEGVVVAQVSGILPGTSAAAPWARGTPIDPAPLALALGALAMLAALAAAASRKGDSPAWERALAAGLVVVIVTAPALPALASTKGNVHADDRLDAADAMLVVRSLMGKITLTPTQTTDADVAPLQSGQPSGDGRVDANDANLLLRAAEGIDVDGDGLSGSQERSLGLSPIDRDSNDNGIADNNEDTDQDGIPNSTEIAQGSIAWDADTDGDGYVDGDDPQPTIAAGTLVAYVHTDHLGGSAVLTDTAGVVVRSIRYEAFGKVRSNARPGAADTLDPAQKFTGQQLDDDTGLYYYGARYYDAQYGRFVSADSVVPDAHDPQALNRYAYGRNDPLQRVDPTGHGSEETISGILESSLGRGGDDYYDGDWRSSGSSESGSDSIGSSNWGLMEYGLYGGSSSFDLAMGSASYVFDSAPSEFQSVQTFGLFSFEGSRRQVPYGPNPRISAAGVEFIKQWEDFRPGLYEDQAGNCTIGFGHLVNMGACGAAATQHFGRDLSEAAGSELLESDIVNRADPSIRGIGVALSQNQVDALTSFVFNIGHLPRSISKALNQGEFASVPGILGRYKYAGGEESRGLTRRRQAEGAMFSVP
ncbi:MAG: glycoside hydrolase family protein, partial [Proteobacteria bacterium]|nr:glycoside hydrolase family protein [Pseudomonadota bacterium]